MASKILSDSLRPSCAKKYNGIDVSQWHGNIDFKTVRREGITAVYIRSSEGSNYKDPYFEQNYRRAKDAGMKIGFYHFVTARSVSQAKYQANFFISTISGKEFEGRLAADFEDLSGLSNSEINSIALEFLTECERLCGKGVVVFSDSYNAGETFDGRMTKYPLWIYENTYRQPGADVIWSSWVGWHNDDSSKVPGIPTLADRDFFTRDIFSPDNAPVDATSEKPAPKVSIIYYTVKRGNTLTGIARLYHTTVNKIVAENSIGNPNLIYIGEVLKIPIYDAEPKTVSTVYYGVKRFDTLTQIAKRFNTTVENIALMNNISNPDLIYPNVRLRIDGEYFPPDGKD